jgi:hypothetical protein
VPNGDFLWCLPPVTPNVVVDQRREAHHKRPHRTYIVVVPQLMTGAWPEEMMKESDIELTIPFRSSV